MKAEFKVIFTICFLLAACDAPPRSTDDSNNNSTANESPSNNDRSYRFTSSDGSCDTFQRIYSTTREMCLGLQVDSLNNNCALAARQVYFDKMCGSMEWYDLPGAAEFELKNTNGKYVECTLSETGLPDLKQFSSNLMMQMEHTSSRAVIYHSYENGRYDLRTTLFSKLNGAALGNKTGSWQDEAAGILVISAPDHIGSPTLTCTVIAAQDPDTE